MEAHHEGGSFMAISNPLLRDFEHFAAIVAKAQAELDSFMGRISPVMQEQMRRIEAEHAKAVAVLEPYMRRLAAMQQPAELPISSATAVHRLLRPHDGAPPPARSII